jgi:hypothetical protein
MSDLLTEDEHALMDTLGTAHGLFLKVHGNGPTRHSDMLEVTHLIHALQAVVMSQAAARAYPDKYRLLGETLKDKQ